MICQFLLQAQCPCSAARSNPLLLLALIAGTGLALYSLQWVFRKAGVRPMNKSSKIAIVAILAVAVGLVIVALSLIHISEPTRPY